MAAQRGTCRKLKNNLSKLKTCFQKIFFWVLSNLERSQLPCCPVSVRHLQSPRREPRRCEPPRGACACARRARMRARRLPLSVGVAGVVVTPSSVFGAGALTCMSARRGRRALRVRGVRALEGNLFWCANKVICKKKQKKNKHLVSYVSAVEMLCDPVCNLECVRRQAHEWPGRARVLWCRSR
jgi:hypothetical protein